MPVFKSGEGLAPKWCELKYFEIVNLPKGTKKEFKKTYKKEKIIITDGKGKAFINGNEVDVAEHTNIDVNENETGFKITEVTNDLTLVRMCGTWGNEVGGSGIFGVAENGKFDNHYHDCDEYWILVKGKGKVVSEGKTYTVGAGDCIATGMGFNHDFPEVFEPVKSVYFETTIEGKKRLGHLWEHQHGKAIPKKDRI
jgi:mannose-6-phosphate isomerase-like protein (cupin superfamily)